MIFIDDGISDTLLHQESQIAGCFNCAEEGNDLYENSSCFDDTSLPFSDFSNFQAGSCINNMMALELSKHNPQLVGLIPPVFSVTRISNANRNKRTYTNSSKKLFKDKIHVHEAIMSQLLESREVKIRRYIAKKQKRMLKLGANTQIHSNPTIQFGL